MKDLLASQCLPPAYGATVDRHWRPLAAHIAARAGAAARPIIVGINGTQGSGKSTLCVFLEALLRRDHGLAAATLSLDDLYLTKSERQALATTIHSLFATRGVPGTHDLALADTVMTALTAGTGRIAIPRFDKARDDRHPEPAWPQVEAPLDVLLFEGWCIGATPQPNSALTVPINPLEAREDPQMTWRAHVNTCLATDYTALFARLDMLVALRAPGFAAVRAWRFEQEAKLRAARGPGAGMDAAALDRFLQHFERLTRHMLATLPATAGVVIELDAARAVQSIRGL